MRIDSNSESWPGVVGDTAGRFLDEVEAGICKLRMPTLPFRTVLEDGDSPFVTAELSKRIAFRAKKELQGDVAEKENTVLCWQFGNVSGVELG